MFTTRIPNKCFEKFHVLLKLEVGSKYQALMRGFLFSSQMTSLKFYKKLLKCVWNS